MFMQIHIFLNMNKEMELKIDLFRFLNIITRLRISIHQIFWTYAIGEMELKWKFISSTKYNKYSTLDIL